MGHFISRNPFYKTVQNIKAKSNLIGLIIISVFKLKEDINKDNFIYLFSDISLLFEKVLTSDLEVETLDLAVIVFLCLSIGRGA